jgi:hypothetical protein
VNFLFPAFLAAGIALAIPILIHLFNFKKFKKIYFPDIRFLQEIKEETNKRSRLKHLLILLSRMLAIASLVFAFCQPFFSNENKIIKGNKCTSIYIDNSYSMAIQKNGVPLLELAKSKAKEIINAASNADNFQILSNEFSPAENKILNKEQALANTNAIQISTLSRNITNVLQKQNACLLTNDAATKQIVYLSDFQKATTPLPVANNDVVRKFFIPIQDNQTHNLTIDTAYFATPTIQMNTENELIVRMRNFDKENAATASINVNVNGQIKTVKNVELKPNENKLEKIAFNTVQAGWQKLKLYITDYPVSFDDTFYMAGNVTANYNILIANEAGNNPYLNAVFKTANSFITTNTNIQSLQAASLKNYSLIVLNNLNNIAADKANILDDYVQKGGSILLFPGNNVQLNSFNTALTQLTGCMLDKLDSVKQNVSSFQKENLLVKDIFDRIPQNVELPFVQKYYPMRTASFSTEQKIFGMADGHSFLSAFTKGLGKIYVCTSPADANSSNFTNSYWFLPLLFKMAYIGKNEPIYAYTLGKDALMTIPNTKGGDNNVFHLASEQWDAIPEQRVIGNSLQLNLNNAAKKANLYSLSIPGNNDYTYYLGLNYNRAESNMDKWTADDIKKDSKLNNLAIVDADINAAAGIGQMQAGTPIWKYCVVAALIFLLIEALLTRMFK